MHSGDAIVGNNESMMPSLPKVGWRIQHEIDLVLMIRR